ncbi:MAG: YaiI/YqxD family protein [Candidatus Obscuribacterales bacterium]|nr:YaiI/YqxD family protein [Candidatus Obscuribacterales bacterium]
MKLWIDADACPVQIKDLISLRCHKNQIEAVFVANSQLKVAESPFISFVKIADGPDVADAYIAAHAESGDIVVTQDIPLAGQLVPKNIVVITPRGDLFSEHNINEALAGRDLMTNLREQSTAYGIAPVSGGPPPFDQKQKRAFANHLDAAIQRLKR